uniref:Endoplasmic reticulum lectin 1 n=1 Tax=Xenopsylla cheopis TaxID=163159 RepID=A0A6M2DQP2_XENCH
MFTFLLMTYLIVSVNNQDLKGFDDTVLYKLDWPGKTEDFLEPKSSESMFITTADKERYQCFVPKFPTQESEENLQYNGPTALELLAPLFSQTACSYRVESYWTYKLCHGRYIQQYHEEREGKKVKTQEYFLGKWSAEQHDELVAEMSRAEKSGEALKTTKIESVSLPYVEVIMTEGTLCDLNNKKRVTRVLYVCYANGKHEIYSLKEISTCEYEVVVLSALLCDHPRYKPADSGEMEISCLPLQGSGRKPQSLVKMEMEALKRRNQHLINERKSAKDVVAVFKVEKLQDGESRVRVEIHPVDTVEKPDPAASLPSALDRPEGPGDTSPVDAFLSGQNCLTGGSGWWKYEFCYGRHVEQYHIETDGRRTSLLLGKFNEDAHLEWLKQHPNKKPAAPGHRTHLSHFYSEGSFCEKIGKRRQTEVKLKCLENSSSPSAVSLYLLEPKTCEYIVGVESPLICNILQKADENGLFTKVDKVSDITVEKVDNEKVETKGNLIEDLDVRFEND